jgi:hypothetical protein
MLTDEQIIAKYGEPGDPDNLTTIIFPYPMRISWDMTKTVSKTQCHKLIVDNLSGVLHELLAYYGLLELQRLEIDIFGGLNNFRLMRGSKKKWSRHSWAIAIDLSPNKNGLKTKWEDAQFSQPAYKIMIDTFYKHGFFSLGKEKGYDAMHWEIAS